MCRGRFCWVDSRFAKVRPIEFRCRCICTRTCLQHGNNLFVLTIGILPSKCFFSLGFVFCFLCTDTALVYLWIVSTSINSCVFCRFGVVLSHCLFWVLLILCNTTAILIGFVFLQVAWFLRSPNVFSERHSPLRASRSFGFSAGAAAAAIDLRSAHRAAHIREAPLNSRGGTEVTMQSSSSDLTAKSFGLLLFSSLWSLSREKNFHQQTW